MPKLTMPSRAADAGKLCACLIGLAAVPAWALAQAPAPENPPAPKPEPTKALDAAAVRVWENVATRRGAEAEAQAIQEQIKALTAKLEMLRQARQQADVKRKMDADLEKAHADAAVTDAELKRHLARVQEVLNFLTAPAVPQQPAAPQKLVAGQNGVKVIGPDGKEIPGVIVVIDPVGTAPAPVMKPLVAPLATPLDARLLAAPPGTITLSRATYKLPKDQAATLAALLGTLKHTVMETKVDGDTLLVTTTPDVQAVVQRFVAMLAGDKTYGYRADGPAPLAVDFTFPVTPPTTAAPAPPAAKASDAAQFYLRLQQATPDAAKAAKLGDMAQFYLRFQQPKADAAKTTEPKLAPPAKPTPEAPKPPEPTKKP